MRKVNNYTPERIAGKMNHKASTSVKEDMVSALLLNISEIKIIMKLLAKYDRHYYIKHQFSWVFMLRLAKNQGYALFIFPENDQMMIIHAIEEAGDEREHFELLREIIRWYGIKRESAKLPYSSVPQDNRPGLYDDSYDGTAWYEFVDQTSVIMDKLIEVTEEQAEFNLAMAAW